MAILKGYNLNVEIGFAATVDEGARPCSHITLLNKDGFSLVIDLTEAETMKWAQLLQGDVRFMRDAPKPSKDEKEAMQERLNDFYNEINRGLTGDN